MGTSASPARTGRQRRDQLAEDVSCEIVSCPTTKEMPFWNYSSLPRFPSFSCSQEVQGTAAVNIALFRGMATLCWSSSAPEARASRPRVVECGFDSSGWAERLNRRRLDSKTAPGTPTPSQKALPFRWSLEPDRCERVLLFLSARRVGKHQQKGPAPAEGRPP